MAARGVTHVGKYIAANALGVAAVAALLSLWPTAPRPAPDSGARIAAGPRVPHRVISWNALAHEYTKYNTHSGQTETEAERQWRVSAFDAALRAAAPDVVLLQEATPRLIAESQWLQQPHVHCALQLRAHSPDGCAVAVDTRHYEVVAVDALHFRSALKPRLSLAVLLRSRRPGDGNATYLAAANVHLEGDPARGDVRRAQALEAAEHLHRLVVRDAVLPTGARVGLVLAGDFNEPDIAPIRAALSAPPHGLIWLGTALATSFFRTARPAVAADAAEFGYAKAIDHVFASAALEPARRSADDEGVTVAPDFGSPRVRSVPYGLPGEAVGASGWGSDHYALVTDLRFAP